MRHAHGCPVRAIMLWCGLPASRELHPSPEDVGVLWSRFRSDMACSCLVRSPRSFIVNALSNLAPAPHSPPQTVNFSLLVSLVSRMLAVWEQQPSPYGTLWTEHGFWSWLRRGQKGRRRNGRAPLSTYCVLGVVNLPFACFSRLMGCEPPQGVNHGPL